MTLAVHGASVPQRESALFWVGVERPTQHRGCEAVVGSRQETMSGIFPLSNEAKKQVIEARNCVCCAFLEKVPKLVGLAQEVQHCDCQAWTDTLSDALKWFFILTAEVFRKY